MARHLWTILCTNSSIDSITNNISLFGVTEQLQLQGAPQDQRLILPAQLQLVVLWMRSDLDQPEMGTCRISIRLPNGEVVAGAEVQIELSTVVRNRSIITMNGIPLYGPGIYHFITDFRSIDAQDWTTVDELPLQVVFN